MEPTSGSGSGYNDPDKLRAAMELAQSFKKGPLKGYTNGKKSRSSRKSEFRDHDPVKMQLKEEKAAYYSGRYRRRPPVQSSHNLPPPSQRRYTNTLVSDTSQIISGPIMGRRALDFLCRQDQRTELDQFTPEHQRCAEAISEAHSIQVPLGFKGNYIEELQADEGVAPCLVHPPVPVVPEMMLSPGNMPPIPTPPVSRTDEEFMGSFQMARSVESQAPQLQSDARSMKGNNILDTFFSLMDQDSEDISKGLFPFTTPQKSSVRSDTSSQINPARVVSGFGDFGGEKVATQVRGETNCMYQYTYRRLRPDAPEFVPNNSMYSGAKIQDFNVGTQSAESKSGLSPDAPTWTPNQLPSQSASIALQTGAAHGHVGPANQTHFTNGFIPSGTIGGQSWPIAVDNDVSINPPSASNFHSNGFSDIATPARTSASGKRGAGSPSERPIVGLSGSRWA
ncbi:hypothetical protein BGZ63DRAFT_455513 [Mariannaea sp. PMI_226]|nr:hypothetical protein BGZ63DRAFT_455513 [Mariannaea sp. PMI_226]